MAAARRARRRRSGGREGCQGGGGGKPFEGAAGESWAVEWIRAVSTESGRRGEGHGAIIELLPRLDGGKVEDLTAACRRLLAVSPDYGFRGPATATDRVVLDAASAVVPHISALVRRRVVARAGHVVRVDDVLVAKLDSLLPLREW